MNLSGEGRIGKNANRIEQKGSSRAPSILRQSKDILFAYTALVNYIDARTGKVRVTQAVPQCLIADLVEVTVATLGNQVSF